MPDTANISLKEQRARKLRSLRNNLAQSTVLQGGMLDLFDEMDNRIQRLEDVVAVLMKERHEARQQNVALIG